MAGSKQEVSERGSLRKWRRKRQSEHLVRQEKRGTYLADVPWICNVNFMGQVLMMVHHERQKLP